MIHSRKGLAIRWLQSQNIRYLQKPSKFRASVSQKNTITISLVHMVDFQFFQGRLYMVIPVVPVVLLLLRSSIFSFWVLTCINVSSVLLTLPGIRKSIHAPRRVEQEICFLKYSQMYYLTQSWTNSSKYFIIYSSFEKL